MVPAEDQAELQASLDFLTAVSARQVKRHKLPHPYVSGVRYRWEPMVRGKPGGEKRRRERWQTALETISRQAGDCKSLAAYLAGWLQAHGHPSARAVVIPSNMGWHCVVDVDGQRIDPSKALGMKETPMPSDYPRALRQA